MSIFGICFILYFLKLSACRGLIKLGREIPLMFLISNWLAWKKGEIFKTK